MEIGNCFDRIKFSLKSKNKLIPIFFVSMVISVLVDSQIGIIADFIPEYLSSPFGISLFFGLTVFSILSSFFMVNYVKRINNTTVGKYARFKLIYCLVFIAQCLIASMLIFVVIQIMIFQEYSSVPLFIIHIISYGIWIGILGLLVRAFILWYRNFDQNSMTLIFAMAMIAYVINGVFGMVNQIDILVQQDRIIPSDYVAYFHDFINFSISDQTNLLYQK